MRYCPHCLKPAFESSGECPHCGEALGKVDLGVDSKPPSGSGRASWLEDPPPSKSGSVEADLGYFASWLQETEEDAPAEVESFKAAKARRAFDAPPTAGSDDINEDSLEAMIEHVVDVGDLSPATAARKAATAYKKGPGVATDLAGIATVLDTIRHRKVQTEPVEPPPPPAPTPDPEPPPKETARDVNEFAEGYQAGLLAGVEQVEALISSDETSRSALVGLREYLLTLAGVERSSKF